MKSILLLPISLACIVNISSPTALFPEFEEYDTSPYFLSTLLASSSIDLTLSSTSDAAIYLNSVYFTTFSSDAATVNISGLQSAENSISLACGSVEYSLKVYVSSSFSGNLSVSLGGVQCGSQDCGNTNQNTAVVTSTSSGLETKVYSGYNRNPAWQVVNGSLSVNLKVGMNYIVSKWSESVVIYKVYKNPIPGHVINLTLSAGGYELYVLPRFTPDVYDYTVSPKLDIATSDIITLLADTQNPSSGSISPKSNLWSAVSFSSGVAVQNLKISIPGDTLVLELQDNAKASSTNFYSFSFTFKNRNTFLKELKLYQASSSSDYTSFTTYSSLISGLSTLTQLVTDFSYSTSRRIYTLSDISYSPDYYIAVAAETAVTTSSLELKRHSGNYELYWTSNKLHHVSIGANTIELKITAEDSYFSLIILTHIYMRSNDTSLKSITIEGEWVPSYSDSQSTYRIYIPYSKNSLAASIETTHSKATLTLSYGEIVVQGMNKINTEIGVDSSLTQTVSLILNAESSEVMRSIDLIVVRMDECGNGRRFGEEEVCDDGNIESGDGCSVDCKVEEGWNCMGGGQDVKDTCTLKPVDNGGDSGGDNGDAGENSGGNQDGGDIGNNGGNQDSGDNGGNQDSGNDGDNGGNQDNGDNGDSGGNSGDNGNTEDNSPRCGDGVLTSPEECDDGNTLNNDGCSSKCRTESNGLLCGDGLRPLSGFEQCDDGNTENFDGCNSNCRIELGWSCSSTSLITNLNPKPDTCYPLQRTFEPVSLSDPNTKEILNNFDYIGSISCFLTIFMLFIFLLMTIFRYKISVDDLLPSSVFFIITCQVLYLLSSQYDSFSSFGWSHLLFPRVSEYRRLMNIIPIESEYSLSFLENIQYFIIVWIGIGVVYLACMCKKMKRFRTRVWNKVAVYWFFVSYLPVNYEGLRQVRDYGESEWEVLNVVVGYLWVVSMNAVVGYSGLLFVCNKRCLLRMPFYIQIVQAALVSRVKLKTPKFATPRDSLSICDRSKLIWSEPSNLQKIPRPLAPLSFSINPHGSSSHIIHPLKPSSSPSQDISKPVISQSSVDISEIETGRPDYNPSLYLPYLKPQPVQSHEISNGSISLHLSQSPDKPSFNIVSISIPEEPYPSYQESIIINHHQSQYLYDVDKMTLIKEPAPDLKRPRSLSISEIPESYDELHRSRESYESPKEVCYSDRSYSHRRSSLHTPEPPFRSIASIIKSAPVEKSYNPFSKEVKKFSGFPILLKLESFYYILILLSLLTVSFSQAFGEDEISSLVPPLPMFVICEAFLGVKRPFRRNVYNILHMTVWGMLILVYSLMLELNNVTSYLIFVLVIILITSFLVSFLMDFLKKLENIITFNSPKPNQEDSIAIRQFTEGAVQASSYRDESVPNERSENSVSFNNPSPIDNGVSSFYDNS